MPVWDKVADAIWRPRPSEIHKRASLPIYAFRSPIPEDTVAEDSAEQDDARVPLSARAQGAPQSARSSALAPAVRSLSQREPDASRSADASSRVAELEAALVHEQQRADHKEEELKTMSQLVTKLEQALETAQKEQERIATLEKAVSQRSSADGEGDKVEKLLLAVARERQLAEERAEELDRVEEELAEERSRRENSERWMALKEKEREDAQSKLAEQESVRARLEADLLSREIEARDLQQRLAEELRLREEATGQLAELRRQSTARNDGAARSAYQSINEKEREICELQQQLAEELSKRREVQYQNLANIEKFMVVQQQLAHERQMNAETNASQMHLRQLTGGDAASDTDAVSIADSAGQMCTSASPGSRQAVGGSATFRQPPSQGEGHRTPVVSHMAPHPTYGLASVTEYGHTGSLQAAGAGASYTPGSHQLPVGGAFKASGAYPGVRTTMQPAVQPQAAGQPRVWVNNTGPTVYYQPIQSAGSTVGATDAPKQARLARASKTFT